MILTTFALLTLSLQQTPTIGGSQGHGPTPRPAARPDCNGNGVSDIVDILVGSSLDCQGDGIPDECQLEPGVAYALDDGELDGAVGTNHDYVGWLQNHSIQAGSETITHIEIAWGALDAGAPATVVLWSDPNGDGDPADAQVLSSAVTSASAPFSGTLVSVDIPDARVGPAGTSFFVGAFGQFDQTWFPAALDNDTFNLANWFVSSDTPLDPNDLTSGAIAEYGLLSQVCACDGTWMVRAISCSTGHCGESADSNRNGVPDECDPDCNANGIPDDLDIASGLETDCDFNAVPDSCQTFDDCDANGIFDICQATTPNGLSGEYYPNTLLAGPPIGRIDSDVVFDFDLNPPFPGSFPVDDFSVRWTGSFASTSAGTYGFGVLHDDGARLWINGRLIIDEWHPSGGDFDVATIDLAETTTYHIRLEYYESNGNALCELHWQPPGGSMLPMLPDELSPILDLNTDGIPDSCQAPDCNGNGVDDTIDISFGNSSDCNGNSIPDECECGDCDRNGWLDACEAVDGPGLIGQYYHSTPNGDFLERAVVRIDATVDFNWATGPPLDQLEENDFGVRWTGTLTVPPTSGVYSFRVQSDDGVRLWLDDTLWIDEWHPSSGVTYQADVNLTAGARHLVRLEYYEAGGDALVHFRWIPPGGVEVVVPASALSPGTDIDGDTVPDLCAADCNLNGIPDSLEVDANGNCIPDTCDGGAGYWRLEELGGLTALDETANGLNGALMGGPTHSTDVPVALVPGTGAPNTQSLDLNWTSPSSGGTVHVPDTGGLLSTGTTSFTLEAWVRLDQLSSGANTDQRQYLFMKKPASTPDSMLDYAFLVQSGDLDGTGRNLMFRYGDGTDARSVTSILRITDTDWHFVSVAVHVTGRQLRFGLDGTYETLFLDKADFVNTGPLVIGGHQNQMGVYNHFLRGSIDEVRFTRAFRSPSDLLDSAP